MEPVNHHLWRNRRTWWVAFTVVHDGHRQERIRRSLGTQEVEVARLRRDALMREYAALPGAQLSIRLAGAPGEPAARCQAGGC